MKEPMSQLMSMVKWEPCKGDYQPAPGELHATHEGVLELMGHPFRVYQLSNGVRVFDADDVHEFFGIELAP